MTERENCRHVKVIRVRDVMVTGSERSYWACDDCDAEFAPRALSTPPSPAPALVTFDKLGADRLADEVAALVRRGILDSRSPVADALLDYRNPPSTPRADRLAQLDSAPVAGRCCEDMRERAAKAVDNVLPESTIFPATKAILREAQRAIRSLPLPVAPSGCEEPLIPAECDRECSVVVNKTQRFPVEHSLFCAKSEARVVDCRRCKKSRHDKEAMFCGQCGYVLPAPAQAGEGEGE